jgi:hypothetical protein
MSAWAGCGDMANRRYFRTKRYIGVDADAARVQGALAEIDDSRVQGVVARIEDLGDDYRADVVVCVQLAGAKFNDPAMMPLIVDRLIALTKQGGSLILTVKEPADRVEQSLRNAFRHVTRRRVGEPSKYGFPKRVPIPRFDSLGLSDARTLAAQEKPQALFLVPRKARVGTQRQTPTLPSHRQ